MAIRSFRDKETRKVFARERTRAVPVELQRKALMRLNQIHYAGDLNDLRVPPGNRLEKLSGDRAVQHSIRVNDRYRVCFVWDEDDAYNVEIVDYH